MFRRRGERVGSADPHEDRYHYIESDNDEVALCRAVGRIVQRKCLQDDDEEDPSNLIEEVEIRPLDQDGDSDDDDDDKGGEDGEGKSSSSGGRGWFVDTTRSWASVLGSVGGAHLMVRMLLHFFPGAFSGVVGGLLHVALALYQAYFLFYRGRHRRFRGVCNGGARLSRWKAHRVVLGLGHKYLRMKNASRRLADVVAALGRGFRHDVESPSAGGGSGDCSSAAPGENYHLVIEWSPRVSTTGVAPSRDRDPRGLVWTIMALPVTHLYDLACPERGVEADLPRVDFDPLLDIQRRTDSPPSMGEVAWGVVAKLWRDVACISSDWTLVPLIVLVYASAVLWTHWAGYARPVDGMLAVYEAVGQSMLHIILSFISAP